MGSGTLTVHTMPWHKLLPQRNFRGLWELKPREVENGLLDPSYLAEIKGGEELAKVLVWAYATALTKWHAMLEDKFLPEKGVWWDNFYMVAIWADTVVSCVPRTGSYAELTGRKVLWKECLK